MRHQADPDLDDEDRPDGSDQRVAVVVFLGRPTLARHVERGER